MTPAPVDSAWLTPHRNRNPASRVIHLVMIRLLRGLVVIATFYRELTYPEIVEEMVAARVEKSVSVSFCFKRGEGLSGGRAHSHSPYGRPAVRAFLWVITDFRERNRSGSPRTGTS